MQNNTLQNQISFGKIVQPCPKLLQSFNSLEIDHENSKPDYTLSRAFNAFEINAGNIKYSKEQSFLSHVSGKNKQLPAIFLDDDGLKELTGLINFISRDIPVASTPIVHVHQLKLVIKPSKTARISLSGVHKDGYKYLATLCLKREYLEGSETQIYTDKKGINKIYSKALEDGEYLVIDDSLFWHFVTDGKVTSRIQNGLREVILIGFCI